MTEVDPQDVSWLAKELVGLRREIRRNTGGKPGLHTSSIEGGSIDEYTVEGTLVSQVGEQFDGTHTAVSLTGPNPPMPTLPTASAVPGMVEFRWNGKFEADITSPMDFKHVAGYVVHVGEPIDLTNQAGVLTGELGDAKQIQVDGPGVYDVYLVAWSLSGKYSDYSGPVSVLVPDSLDGATLNGKMTVATHAPSLEDGVDKPDDALWNQIDPETDAQVAVWRWTGSEWVDFPISETMLPLVNIAEGTYGRLQGVQLEGDAIDGMVITGAIIQSPGEGAGYQLTEGGYTSRDDAGNVTVRLPADGSPAQFRGDVEARSLTATGRVSLQAPGNEIAAGADLTLEAGVTAPLTPPTVGSAYTSVAFPPMPEAGSITGLAYADGLWWRAVDVGGVSGTLSGDRLEGLDAAGNIVRSININFWAKNGITAIGTELYLLGHREGYPTDTRWVKVYDAVTGAYTGVVWEYAQYGTGTYQPGIGTDGTNVMIAQSDALGRIRWRKLDKATGAVLSATGADTVITPDIIGVFQGTADFGATSVAVSRADGITNVFDAAGNPVSNAGWASAGRAPIVGATYAGGAFRQLTTAGDLVTYTGFQNPDGDSADWWAAVTWTDGSSAETTIGPAVRFQFFRRSEIQVSAGTLPVGATGVKVYLARRNTTPARADLHLVGSAVGPSARIAVLPSNWETLANPPVTNTFATGTPASLRSRSANFEVKGDGSGKWGPLVFNANGTMTSTATPTWVPITNFLNGCTVGDFGYVPAYRIWPDGKVELRGIIKGPLTGTSVFNAATLPAAAQPAEHVSLPCATDYASGNPGTMKVEFGVDVAPNNIRFTPAGATRAWASLDGLYYYLV